MVILERATMDDAARLLEWRMDPATRMNSHNGGLISFEHHSAWLEGVLRRDSTRLFVVRDTKRGQLIGTCRLDRDGQTAQVSLTVSPQERGQGYAVKILEALRQEALSWGIDKLTAETKASNIASRRAFLAANFRQLDDSEPNDLKEIVEFELWVKRT